MRKALIALIVTVLVFAGGFVWYRQSRNSERTDTAAKSATPAFNKSLYSTTDAASFWVVVNKLRPLQPTSYEPVDLRIPGIPLRAGRQSDDMQLRAAAASALERMVAAAATAGHKLMLASGYRSFNYQSGLYDTYVRTQGKATADTQSARPGYSEHQTGLAADIEPASRKCEVEECFATTPEGIWVARNAYKYGFIIRYPQSKQEITGYVYEPWHLRYVGVPLATELHKQGNPTLEEFFGMSAAPDYP